MPRGDGTGPNGRGSGTGRAMGYCSGSDAPGFAGAPGWGGFRSGFGRGGFGRGFLRGMGRGGFGGAWRQDIPGESDTTDRERQNLQQQAKALESSLEDIKARLARLENETPRE